MSSPAGGAAGSAGGDAGPAQDAGQGQNGGGESFDASAAFGELRAGQEQQHALLRELMDGRDPRAAANGAEDDGSGDDLADGFDLSEFDDLDAGEYDGYDESPHDGVDLDQLAQQFGDGAAQAAAAAVEPVHRELQQLRSEQSELRVEQQWRDVVGDHPELGDSETQQAVFDTARQLVDGGHLPPQFAFGPVGAKLIFMAQRAAEMAAAEEGREEVPAAHLEGAAGAGPGGSGPDLGDEIISAGPLGAGALDFS